MKNHIDNPCFCKKWNSTFGFQYFKFEFSKFGIEFELQYSERKGARIK